MPKSAVPRPIPAKTAATTSLMAGLLMACLFLMAMGLSNCKKNRSEAALQILPDPQAQPQPRTQAPADSLLPRDTAAFPARNDLTRNDSTALDFTSNLYGNYGLNSSFNPRDQGADTIFTPELLSLIRQDETQAKGEVGYLDGDPLCDCQDFDITGVRIALQKSAPSRLIAEVRFLNFDRPDTLALSLLQTGSSWRIEDIRSRSSSSLRNDLRTYLTQTQAKP
jgi:uncharacterized protein DUF3828